MRAKLINEEIKHLSPKSEEEISNLKKKGYIYNGGKWQFSINISELLRQYEDDENTKSFKTNLIELLENKIEYLDDILDDEYALSSFQEVIDELGMLDTDPEESEVNYVLEMLFDWADEYNIWIEQFGE